MTSLRWLPVACLLLAGSAFAQSSDCPALPAESGLSWQKLDGPGFLFCKAMRADGSQAFAVTISRESPFKPRRGDRAEEASIDGRDVHWYRSEIAADPDAIVRETLVELGEDRVAHITLRAASEEQKLEAMQQAQTLSFRDARLSSN